MIKYKKYDIEKNIKLILIIIMSQNFFKYYNNILKSLNFYHIYIIKKNIIIINDGILKIDFDLKIQKVY